MHRVKTLPAESGIAGVDQTLQRRHDEHVGERPEALGSNAIIEVITSESGTTSG